MKSAMIILRSVRISEFAVAFRTCYRKYSTEDQTKKTDHPYFRIHPWKSEKEFANDLLNNIIYNGDGIIAINKPYGISVFNTKQNTAIHLHQKIVGKVDYTIGDILPYLAQKLDVPILIPCLGSEKYVSGVYIFGVNEKVCEQIELARQRTLGKYRKYWAITIRVPQEIKGKYRLGMILKTSELGDKKPVILTRWSNNEMKRGEVKIMNVDHKVLSNSTHNLSSLIEIDSSARKWNAIRLFTSTMLYSPILGDNIHGSRVQELMGTWLRVDPFADSCWSMPKINQQLLNLLCVTPNQQEVIPTHLHLRSVRLIFGKEKRNIIIEAPLMDPFDWTCKQLMFKIPDEARNVAMNNETELAYIQHDIN